MNLDHLQHLEHILDKSLSGDSVASGGKVTLEEQKILGSIVSMTSAISSQQQIVQLSKKEQDIIDLFTVLLQFFDARIADHSNDLQRTRRRGPIRQQRQSVASTFGDQVQPEIDELQRLVKTYVTDIKSYSDVFSSVLYNFYVSFARVAAYFEKSTSNRNANGNKSVVRTGNETKIKILTSEMQPKLDQLNEYITENLQTVDTITASSQQSDSKSAEIIHDAIAYEIYFVECFIALIIGWLQIQVSKQRLLLEEILVYLKQHNTNTLADVSFLFGQLNLQQACYDLEHQLTSVADIKGEEITKETMINLIGSYERLFDITKGFIDIFADPSTTAVRTIDGLVGEFDKNKDKLTSLTIDKNFMILFTRFCNKNSIESRNQSFDLIESDFQMILFHERMSQFLALYNRFAEIYSNELTAPVWTRPASVPEAELVKMDKKNLLFDLFLYKIVVQFISDAGKMTGLFDLYTFDWDISFPDKGLLEQTQQELQSLVSGNTADSSYVDLLQSHTLVSNAINFLDKYNRFVYSLLVTQLLENDMINTNALLLQATPFTDGISRTEIEDLANFFDVSNHQSVWDLSKSYDVTSLPTLTDWIDNKYRFYYEKYQTLVRLFARLIISLDSSKKTSLKQLTKKVSVTIWTLNSRFRKIIAQLDLLIKQGLATVPVNSSIVSLTAYHQVEQISKDDALTDKLDMQLPAIQNRLAHEQRVTKKFYFVYRDALFLKSKEVSLDLDNGDLVQLVKNFYYDIAAIVTVQKELLAILSQEHNFINSNVQGVSQTSQVSDEKDLVEASVLTGELTSAASLLTSAIVRNDSATIRESIDNMGRVLDQVHSVNLIIFKTIKEIVTRYLTENKMDANPLVQKELAKLQLESSKDSVVLQQLDVLASLNPFMPATALEKVASTSSSTAETGQSAVGGDSSSSDTTNACQRDLADRLYLRWSYKFAEMKNLNTYLKQNSLPRLSEQVITKQLRAAYASFYKNLRDPNSEINRQMNQVLAELFQNRNDDIIPSEPLLTKLAQLDYIIDTVDPICKLPLPDEPVPKSFVIVGNLGIADLDGNARLARMIIDRINKDGQETFFSFKLQSNKRQLAISDTGSSASIVERVQTLGEPYIAQTEAEFCDQYKSKGNRRDHTRQQLEQELSNHTVLQTPIRATNPELLTGNNLYNNSLYEVQTLLKQKQSRPSQATFTNRFLKLLDDKNNKHINRFFAYNPNLDSVELVIDQTTDEPLLFSHIHPSRLFL